MRSLSHKVGDLTSAEARAHPLVFYRRFFAGWTPDDLSAHAPIVYERLRRRGLLRLIPGKTPLPFGGDPVAFTASILNSLAELYRAQGRYTEAEPLYQRALAIWEQTLGPDHPATATNLNNLALLYSDTGRYTEAEPLLKRAIAIGEKTLGPEHPDLAIRLNNLAVLYLDTGRYEEAEPLLKRAIAIREKTLPPDHPHLMRGREDYAVLLDRLGRTAEAAALRAPAPASR